MNSSCRSSARTRAGGLALLALALAACADSPPTSPQVLVQPAEEVVQLLRCEGSRVAETFACAPLQPGAGDARSAIFGGQGTYVQVTGTDASYNSTTEIYSVNVTIQNLMNEAMGTPDGVTPHTTGIRVFFHSGPTITDGTGSIDVANATSTAVFTAPGQPYFQYDEVLAKDQVSQAKPWQLNVSPTVNTFSFLLAVSTELQPLLVINEVMANPAGTTIETNGDWFELYNAGTRSVNLQGMVVADSAASGRRAYQEITSPLTVEPGGYVVVGVNSNTTSNGGVPVDFVYGGMILPNSLDAVKLARVYGLDTLTIDRTQYSSASSVQDGVSRELKNPALDNSNMDGSNWAGAAVTAVYGTGGRGTPKAQNSAYTP